MAHHGDSAYPELMEWIKDRLDQILGLGPWAIVTLAALITVALPIGLVLLYLAQKRQTGFDPYQVTGGEQQPIVPVFFAVARPRRTPCPAQGNGVD